MGDVIFLSYAHKEFYFAESVALRLQRDHLPIWFDVESLLPGLDWRATLQAGLASCTAFVLIGSRAAFASPEVRAEWTAAQARNVPIYVVLFERVRLPAELKPALIIAPGSHFEQAMSHLAAALQSDQSGVAPKQQRRPLLLHPLAVQVVTVCLWSLALFPVSIAVLLALDITSVHWSAQFGNLGGLVLLLAGVGGSWLGMMGYGVYYASVFTLRRRVRLTELRLALGFWPLAAVAAVEFVLIEADQLIYSDVFGLSIGVHDENALVLALPLAAISAALALVGWLCTLRSADVFRWLPAGAASDRIRAEHNPSPSVLAAVGRPASPVRTVHLQYQPEEELIAQDVRAAVKSVRDLREVGDDTADILLVVLSSATPRAWIEQLASDTARTIYIIGSSLDLPADLVAVHRNQWLDYRLREASRLKTLAALLNHEERRRYEFPAVPESLGELVVPRSVWFFGNTLRALGAIALAVGISGLLPFVRGAGPFAADDARHSAALALGVGWFWLASRMSLWDSTYRWLVAACAVLAIALLIAGVPQEYVWLYSGGDSGRTALGMITLVAVPLAVFGFTRAGIATWLPSRGGRRRGATLRLAGWRKQWRVYLLYVWLVLQLILGLADARLLLSMRPLL